MLIRLIAAHARTINSPTHEFYSDDIDHGEKVEVPDELGVALCDQTDVWAPADDDAEALYAAHVKAAEKAAAAADKAEHPDETPRERKARLKAEQEAADLAAQEAAAAAKDGE